jgi:hypothetical protein
LGSVREVTGISGPIFGKQRSLKTFVFFRGLLFQRQVVEHNREAIRAARSGCYNGHRRGKSNAGHLAQFGTEAATERRAFWNG